jgi:hypothetical protein
MRQLQPCSECQRHVASSETKCPFCGAAIVAEPARTLPLGRLSRAAVFAGAALATSACGGTKAKPADTTQTGNTGGSGSAQTETPPDAGPVTVPDHMQAKPYGAPPVRRRIV